MENAVTRICFVPSMTWNKLPGLTEYSSKSDVHDVRAVAAFFPTANSNNRLINDRLPCAWQHNWGLCPSDVSLGDDVKMPNVHRDHRCWLWPRHEFGRETNELQCVDETHGRFWPFSKLGWKGLTFSQKSCTGPWKNTADTCPSSKESYQDQLFSDTLSCGESNPVCICINSAVTIKGRYEIMIN